MRLRVVIVDDQAPMRSAFRTILEAADLEVVGEAADGRGAIDIVARRGPDVTLMDVRMPELDGVSATAAIVAASPRARVLILTTFDDDDALHGALRAGARGFLLKNSTPEELLAAIRRIADGDAVLDPAVTRRMLTRLAAPPPVAPSEPFQRLTEREKDVLALIAEGLTNAEIAGRLGVGEATAKTHVSRVLMKLGVRDRVQAVIAAYETGFIASNHTIPGPR